VPRRALGAGGGGGSSSGGSGGWAAVEGQTKEEVERKERDPTRLLSVVKRHVCLLLKDNPKPITRLRE
jgi:hypothetical protein